MKASAEQLLALRTVARALGSLNREVVYVGGVTAGLLVTDPGAPPARPTKDVDLVIEVASTVEYQTKLRKRLLRRGFREDSSKGAPLCRWLLGPIAVDVMPIRPGILGFSNEWYAHARATAKTIALPPDADGVVSIQVIAAPAFVATKLVAWKDRGAGDLLHSDIEDVIAVVDGRPQLLEEMEAETLKLRQFLADSVTALLAAGLEDQISGNLHGDSGSQARVPIVLATLRRIARRPTILRLGQRVTARSGGNPGATHIPSESPWDWEILAIEKALASTPSPGSSHVAVVAQLKNHSMTAGTTGDGRDVCIEDSTGRQFAPLYKLLHGERRKRQMPEPYDQILPGQPFDTVWVYELPASAKALRLLLPFDGLELPFDIPS
jgi:predicted nucleotidyltransferase